MLNDLAGERQRRGQPTATPDRSRKGAGLPERACVFVARELVFMGSFGMQAQRYPEMLRMVGAGQLHPEKLVEQRIPVEKASDVLESMSSFGTVGVAVINEF